MLLATVERIDTNARTLTLDGGATRVEGSICGIGGGMAWGASLIRW